MAKRVKQGNILKYEGVLSGVLLVEGSADFYVVGHLCKEYAIEFTEYFSLISPMGYTQLRDSLDTYLDQSELDYLGIVVDADADLSRRWQSLRDRLSDNLCRYDLAQLPNLPDPAGTIVVQTGRPRLGIWIMPDNQNMGAVERFLQQLVPANDELWEYAKTCVQSLPEKPQIPEESWENWSDKAHLHTWLAWRTNNPGKSIGEAITSKDLDITAVEAQAFIAWIRRLFETGE